MKLRILRDSCFHRWESRLTGGGLAVRINNYEEKPPAILETLQQALDKYKK